MKKIELKGEIRNIFGRKVKNLRVGGKLPASIYGKKRKSLSIQVEAGDFTKTFAEAGETGIISLLIGSETFPVMVKNLQIHPLTRAPLHVDFYQVDLKEKVKVKVPLEFTGSAPAAEQKLGVTLKLLDEIEVEALPGELPDKLNIDLSLLAKVGDTIKVADLKLPQGVGLVTEAETEIVKIAELISKEAEALAKEEEAAKLQAEAQVSAEAPQETTKASEETATEPPKPATEEKKTG